MADDPRTPAEKTLAEHVELLSEILSRREDGNFDMRAGNSNEDLVYALEEVRDAIPASIAALEAR